MATLYTQPLRAEEHYRQQLPKPVADAITSKGLAFGKNYITLSPEQTQELGGRVNQIAVEIGSYKGKCDTQVSVQFLENQKRVEEICFLFRNQESIFYAAFDEDGRDYLPMIDGHDEEALSRFRKEVTQ